MGLFEYPRVFQSLARFLDRPLTLEQSKAIVRRRLETRDERFLEFVTRYNYGYPRSPYLPLLRLAGCEHGDLQATVRQRGLEATLKTLRVVSASLFGWVGSQLRGREDNQ